MKAEIINGKTIAIKEINNQRLVTFKEIDEVHERPEGTADRNFRENKKRFVEGEDYYKITKSQQSEIRGLEIPNRGLIVFTESGYLMIVKSLTDDLAWQVQRQLVNVYFRSKEQSNNQQEIINRQMQTLMSQQNQFFQTVIQTLQSQQPQPIYPQRNTPFKTKMFAKINLLSNYYNCPLNTIIHSAIVELEDTYDISLADYKTQYIINTRLKPEEVQVLDIIEYNPDIAKLFNLTLNNILEQNNIPYENTERRPTVFTQTQTNPNHTMQ